MKTNRFVFGLLVSSILAACSAYGTRAASPTMTSNGVLTGANGMTLYTFDRDAAGSGKSVCNGPCAANWPPLLVVTDTAPSGDYSIVTRDDGQRQWALRGKPLYYWSKDQKAGDTTGDGVNNVWHVAKP